VNLTNYRLINVLSFETKECKSGLLKDSLQLGKLSGKPPF